MPKVFRPQRRHPQAGFSLIEAMIAALLLLIVILGILPLVTRGIMNNLQGNDASNEANASMDGIERLLSLPFDNIAMEVPTGSTSLVSQDFYTLTGHDWVTTVPSTDLAQYTRTSTIQQYSASDLDLDETLDSPLDGGVGSEFVHIKRITMTIQNARRYFSGAGAYRVLAVQTY